MKKIFGALIALFTSVAFGATLVPIQLLNPTGSTSGQAIVSTGASSAPAWTSLSTSNVSGLGTAATQNTGTSGATIPLLNGANTWSGAQTFSALVTPSTTIGIKGTTAADSAQAGSIGEVLSGSNGSATSMTTGTAANVFSLPLTAGDWDVYGSCVTAPAGSTVTVQMVCGLTTTSGVMPSWPAQNSLAPGSTAGVGNSMNITPIRVNVSTSTTVYVVMNVSFTTSTLTANGYIFARRRR